MDNKSWRCVIHREINITPSYLVSNKSDESSVMSGGCGGENINMTLLSHNSSVYFVKMVQVDLCVVVCKTMETWSRPSYLAII